MKIDIWCDIYKTINANNETVIESGCRKPTTGLILGILWLVQMFSGAVNSWRAMNPPLLPVSGVRGCVCNDVYTLINRNEYLKISNYDIYLQKQIIQLPLLPLIFHREKKTSIPFRHVPPFPI